MIFGWPITCDDVSGAFRALLDRYCTTRRRTTLSIAFHTRRCRSDQSIRTTCGRAATSASEGLRAEGITIWPQGITNVVMKNWDLHIYYNIPSLVHRTSVDKAGFPRNLAENKDSNARYSRGTCWQENGRHSEKLGFILRLISPATLQRICRHTDQTPILRTNVSEGGTSLTLNSRGLLMRESFPLDVYHSRIYCPRAVKKGDATLDQPRMSQCEQSILSTRLRLALDQVVGLESPSEEA
jgi:hypothetical protein